MARNGDVARGAEGRLADAELPVHHRRVVDGEVAVASRRAALLNPLDGLAGERGRELGRVLDGGRRAEELRIAPVEPAQPLQAAQHVAHMRAVDAAVHVQLVDDHVLQVLEELHPLGVMGQDALVQHVGVGDHDVRLAADGLARVLRGVAVVGEGGDVLAESLDGGVELGELILREGLGGEEVERPRVGVFDDGVEDGQVVALGQASR